MYFLIHPWLWINDKRMAVYFLELGYIVSVHCREEGCIGLYIPNGRGKSRGPRGMYFPMHPESRQCTSILSALAGKYWFCSVFFIRNLISLIVHLLGLSGHRAIQNSRKGRVKKVISKTKCYIAFCGLNCSRNRILLLYMRFEIRLARLIHLCT